MGINFKQLGLALTGAAATFLTGCGSTAGTVALKSDTIETAAKNIQGSGFVFSTGLQPVTDQRGSQRDWQSTPLPVSVVVIRDSVGNVSGMYLVRPDAPKTPRYRALARDSQGRALNQFYNPGLSTTATAALVPEDQWEAVLNNNIAKAETLLNSANGFVVNKHLYYVPEILIYADTGLYRDGDFQSVARFNDAKLLDGDSYAKALQAMSASWKMDLQNLQQQAQAASMPQGYIRIRESK